MTEPIRIGFVMHVMQVAGAEMLVAETIRHLGPSLDPVVLCLDGVGQLGVRLRSEGVPVVELGRKPGLDVRVAGRLAREITAHSLQLIHAHQYTPFFYTALARMTVRRPVRVMFTEHGRHYPDVVSARRRITNRLVLGRLADEITAVCGFSADCLADHDGFERSRIRVIQNGVDVGRYADNLDAAAARHKAGLAQGRRYITCVARFHPVKDHETLIRGFATVAAARPDVDLLLAGDGALRSDLERLTASLQLQARVAFLGVRDDVADILRASDLFTLTSLSEASSLTLLEAMATGLPVVVTDVGGNPEIVEHERSGLLVPRQDPAALSAALLRILDAADFARTLGSAARARVRDRFQLSDTIETYFERYQAAIAGLHGRPRPRAVA